MRSAKKSYRIYWISTLCWFGFLITYFRRYLQGTWGVLITNTQKYWVQMWKSYKQRYWYHFLCIECNCVENDETVNISWLVKDVLAMRCLLTVWLFWSVVTQNDENGDAVPPATWTDSFWPPTTSLDLSSESELSHRSITRESDPLYYPLFMSSYNHGCIIVLWWDEGLWWYMLLRVSIAPCCPTCPLLMIRLMLHLKRSMLMMIGRINLLKKIAFCSQVNQWF